LVHLDLGSNLLERVNGGGLVLLVGPQQGGDAQRQGTQREQPAHGEPPGLGAGTGLILTGAGKWGRGRGAEPACPRTPGSLAALAAPGALLRRPSGAKAVGGPSPGGALR